MKNRINNKRVVIYIVLGILITLMIIICVYAYNNTSYDIRAVKKVYKAGYSEKNVRLSDDSIINYVEGPDAGPDLLLIHGQTMSWEDYANVLPKLAKRYHVYAIDCYGHGKSSKDSLKYTCKSMGEDINWFIENVIKNRCVLSGHSSGGIIAGWIAANYPENIEYLVLEDPPFFSVSPEEMQNTFVWLDGFKLIHDYNEHSAINTYTEFYMRNSYFWGLFGDLQPLVADKAVKYLEEHPGEPLKLWYIPYKWIHGTRYLNDFDLMFAERFYDGTWLESINQEELLRNIKTQTTYIKAKTLYGDDGVLYAANTDKDANKVLSTIDNCEMITIESGHDIHFEKPKEFIDILYNIADDIER